MPPGRFWVSEEGRNMITSQVMYLSLTPYSLTVFDNSLMVASTSASGKHDRQGLRGSRKGAFAHDIMGNASPGRNAR